MDQKYSTKEDFGLDRNSNIIELRNLNVTFTFDSIL